MQELIHFGPLIGLIVVVAVFSIPVIAIVGHYAHAALKTWLEIALKRDMVARGYSVQEIVEVVASRRGKAKHKGKLCDVPPAKPIKQPAYSP